jgi:hypothetical protein
VAVVVFLVGAVTAFASILATTTQHNYYKNVRDQKTRLESSLGLGTAALATTTGMGAVRSRIAKVTTIQKLILVTLIVADLTGAYVAIGRALRGTPAARVEVVAIVTVTHTKQSRSIPVVFSRHGRIEAAARTHQGGMVVVQLRPGRYQVAALTSAVCKSTAEVTHESLQRVTLSCS